jgi:hypothetical protein
MQRQMHEVFYDDRRTPFPIDLAPNNSRRAMVEINGLAERIEVPFNARPIGGRQQVGSRVSSEIWIKANAMRGRNAIDSILAIYSSSF